MYHYPLQMAPGVGGWTILSLDVTKLDGVLEWSACSPHNQPQKETITTWGILCQQDLLFLDQNPGKKAGANVSQVSLKDLCLKENRLYLEIYRRFLSNWTQREGK